MSKTRRAQERRQRQRATPNRTKSGTDTKPGAEWADWQDHQYVPGYYAGKPSNPGLPHFRRTGLVGKLLVVGFGCLILATLASALLSMYPGVQPVVILGLGGVGIACVVAALVFWLWQVVRGKNSGRPRR